MPAVCSSRCPFKAPSRILGLFPSLSTGKKLCSNCYYHLSEKRQDIACAVQLSVLKGEVPSGDDGDSDDGDDEDAPSAPFGAAGVLLSHVPPAIPDAPASSSTDVPPPPTAPPQFVRKRRSFSSDHPKGRLKKCAKPPPKECRGNAAPTHMDDEG